MKAKLTLILFVITSIAISSCKKENKTPNPPVLQVTVFDYNKTITIAKGQTIRITIDDPGDGGYALDVPHVNASILTLTSHVHSVPEANAVGDFGNDTYKFTAISSGSSEFLFEGVRGANEKIVLFTGTVVVK